MTYFQIINMLTENVKPIFINISNTVKFSIVFAVMPSFVFGQFGVNYNQSDLPFVGLSYELNDRIRPEIRFGTDSYFEQISFEGILTYDLVNENHYEFYGGLGVRTQPLNEKVISIAPNLVIPIGLNIYPLPSKEFGFQIELAPIVGISNILRGSMGIRYRFVRNKSNEQKE